MGNAMPIVQTGGADVMEVAAGQTFTCVLLAALNVKCFGIDNGYDDFQQRDGSSVPADVALGGQSVSHIAG
eukprot:1625598-Rhodomonas_salina.1